VKFFVLGPEIEDRDEVKFATGHQLHQLIADCDFFYSALKFAVFESHCHSESVIQQLTFHSVSNWVLFFA
jgi:hypothetical protein